MMDQDPTLQDATGAPESAQSEQVAGALVTETFEGLRHPDLYGTVFAASPGAGYRPPSVMPSALPRTYLTAGSLEPFFLDNATRWADALRTAGADVVMSEQVGNHGDSFWETEFLKMVDWAFGD